MKKISFVANSLKAFFAFLLLLFALSKNKQISLRMMIIFFLLLLICYIAKNICSLLDKPTGVKIFHKAYIIIFLLFGFFFLLVWSYAWIKEKQYFPLLFTIPIWIFEVHSIRKIFMKR